FDPLAVHVRQAVARGVRNIDDVRAGCDYGFMLLLEEFKGGTSGVFGEELDFYAFTFRILNGPHALFEYLFTCGVEFVFDVTVGGAQAGMDPLAFGVFQGFRRDVYVVFLGAGKRTYPCSYRLGNLDHGEEVARA